MSLVLCSVSATALSFGARAPMRVNAPVMMSEPISALTPIGAPVSDLEGVVVPIGGAPARTVRIADLKAAGAAAVASRAELQAAYMAKAGATASVAPTQKMSIAELKAAGADAVASRFFLQTSYENKVASKACAAAEPVTEEAVVKEPVAAPEPAAAPEPVAEEPVAAAEPAAAEPAAVEAVASDSMLSSRPAYVWNPQGLTVEGLPEELKPFKDQFVTEYVTGVPSYLDGTYEGDVGFDPWGLVALGGLSPSEASSLTTAERRMAKLTGMSAVPLQRPAARERALPLRRLRRPRVPRAADQGLGQGRRLRLRPAPRVHAVLPAQGDGARRDQKRPTRHDGHHGHGRSGVPVGLARRRAVGLVLRPLSVWVSARAGLRAMLRARASGGKARPASRTRVPGAPEYRRGARRYRIERELR